MAHFLACKVNNRKSHPVEKTTFQMLQDVSGKVYRLKALYDKLLKENTKLLNENTTLKKELSAFRKQAQ